MVVTFQSSRVNKILKLWGRKNNGPTIVGTETGAGTGMALGFSAATWHLEKSPV